MAYSDLISQLQSSGTSGYDGPDSYEKPDLLERLDIFRGWPTDKLKPLAAEGDIAAVSIISDRIATEKRWADNKAKESPTTAIEDLLANNMPSGDTGKPQMPQAPRGMPGANDALANMGPPAGAGGIAPPSYPSPQMAARPQPGMPTGGPPIPPTGIPQGGGPRPMPVMGAKDGGLVRRFENGGSLWGDVGDAARSGIGWVEKNPWETAELAALGLMAIPAVGPLASGTARLGIGATRLGLKYGPKALSALRAPIQTAGKARLAKRTKEAAELAGDTGVKGMGKPAGKAWWEETLGQSGRLSPGAKARGLESVEGVPLSGAGRVLTDEQMIGNLGRQVVYPGLGLGATAASIMSGDEEEIPLDAGSDAASTAAGGPPAADADANAEVKERPNTPPLSDAATLSPYEFPNRPAGWATENDRFVDEKNIRLDAIESIESMKRSQRGMAKLAAAEAIAGHVGSFAGALTKGGSAASRSLNDSNKTIMDLIDKQEGRAIQQRQLDLQGDDIAMRRDYYEGSLEARREQTSAGITEALIRSGVSKSEASDITKLNEKLINSLKDPIEFQNILAGYGVSKAEAMSILEKVVRGSAVDATSVNTALLRIAINTVRYRRAVGSGRGGVNITSGDTGVESGPSSMEYFGGGS